MCRRLFTFFVLFFAVSAAVVETRGGDIWSLPQTRIRIQVDGLLQEWSEVPGFVLRAGSEGVRAEGITAPEDTSVEIKGLWDKDNLYLALAWTDDTWDVERVLRTDAVWITPSQQRRDRGLFFDYLKLSIPDLDYDYIFWVSPRIQGRGPFFWQRLLDGARRLEAASSDPAVSARDSEGMATLEVMFKWRELKVKPKEGKILPLRFLLADSDLPGKPLEVKLSQLKSLEWSGSMRLAK